MYIPSLPWAAKEKADRRYNFSEMEKAAVCIFDRKVYDKTGALVNK